MKLLKIVLAAIAVTGTITIIGCTSKINVNPTSQAKQMIFVVADGWLSTIGRLQRYGRQGLQYPWVKVGNPIPVSLGKNGLGLGIGLNIDFPIAIGGPKVAEGSKKSPVGAFAIKRAFGMEPAKVLGVKLPYQQIDNNVVCSDDPKSHFYNCIVNSKKVKPDWNSAEDMNQLMKEGLYKFGIMIEHNPKRIPYAGSCFFMHVHRKPGAPTAGCTAFEEAAVKETLLWLEPKQNPVLVQVTKEFYERVKKEWKLPEINEFVH